MGEVIHPKEESTPKEIERKFVITSLPPEMDINRYKKVKIDQGYLANDGNAAVRIRRKGAKYFLTYKAANGSHAAERTEVETPLSAEQFETFWPATKGRRIEKVRYEIPYNSYMIELDIFEGQHSGRMLAEVEFPSTYEADMFQPPEWFGVDVTADKRFGNASIAENGFPT